MTLRVAITRALPEAMRTADRVRAYGAEPVLAPLLIREPLRFEPPSPSTQALLFTSSAAPPLFAAAHPATLPALCVGDATAAAARAAGFADVRSADGDVEKLAALAAATLDPAKGALLHISGADVAGDLAARLRGHGFAVDRRIAYKAHAVRNLPEAFAGALDIVLFHSPRAAETFLRLGAPRAGALTAGCLSPAIAAAAGKTQWKSVIVAPAPRDEALLQAVLQV